VARALNADLLTCATCFGPIHWDNQASDWDKWLNDADPADVAKQYMDDINSMGKGIILMHDNVANVRRWAAKNRGLALAQNLVPMLKAAGFQISRVDAIPAIAAQAAAGPQIALRGVNQAYVRFQGTGEEILVNSAAPTTDDQLTVLPLGSNRVAFQGPNGEYVSLSQDGVTMSVTATTIGEWETFEAVPCGNGEAIFRTFTGDFLSIGTDSALIGNGGQTHPQNRFSLFLYGAGSAAGPPKPPAPIRHPPKMRSAGRL
jgi:hypothetical protein